MSDDRETTNTQTDEIDKVNQEGSTEGFLTPKHVKEELEEQDDNTPTQTQ